MFKKNEIEKNNEEYIIEYIDICNSNINKNNYCSQYIAYIPSIDDTVRIFFQHKLEYIKSSKDNWALVFYGEELPLYDTLYVASNFFINLKFSKKMKTFYGEIGREFYDTYDY